MCLRNSEHLWVRYKFGADQGKAHIANMDNFILVVWALAVFTPVIADTEARGSIVVALKTIPTIYTSKGKLDQVYLQVDITSRGRLHKPLLFNFMNQYYYGEMGFGSRAQKLNIQFDTSSTFLWVIAAAFCNKNKIKCRGHQFYDNKESANYGKDGRSFTVRYVTGSIRATFGKDDFSLGGVTGKAQLFGEAYNMDESLLHSKIDGVFGFSFGDIKFQGSNIDLPFLTLIKQKKITTPVFSFYLTKYGSKKKSELILGDVDKRKYKGQVTYTKVVSGYNWVIIVEKLDFGNQPLRGPFETLVDTGSTALSFPKPIFDILVKFTSATYDNVNGVYLVDCKNVNNLPDVTFTISGNLFKLSGKDYVVEAINSRTKSKFCWLGAVAIRSGVILGTTFMQKYYTEFNLGDLKNGVGFAPAV